MMDCPARRDRHVVAPMARLLAMTFVVVVGPALRAGMQPRSGCPTLRKKIGRPTGGRYIDTIMQAM